MVWEPWPGWTAGAWLDCPWGARIANDSPVQPWGAQVAVLRLAVSRGLRRVLSTERVGVDAAGPREALGEELKRKCAAEQ